MISDRILKQLIVADDPATEPRKPAKKKEPEGVDHTTRPVLMERAAYLKQMARASEGSASEILKEYPRHNIQLSVRLRSGIAELHERFADIFFVLEGRATLVTGGTIVDAKPTGPGEIRGSMVVDGERQPQTSWAVSTTSCSLAHCSSSVSKFPSMVDAKPH